jgi:glycosyltransferase involved in cell wall biosynthesis
MSKKTQVIIIGPHYDTRGGISRVSRVWRDRGLFDSNIKYLPSYCDGNILNHLYIYSICLINLLFELITNKNLKIIHVTSSIKGSFLRKSLVLNIAKMFKKKTILHFRGEDLNSFYDSQPDYIKKYITDVLNNTDVILALSKEWKVEIGSKCDNKNIKILYNPAILPLHNHKNSSEFINVLFMGRIGKRKGAYEIIEAAKLLRDEKIIFNLCGDGSVDEFKELVRKNGLQNTVKINNWVFGIQKDEKYKEADICILPTFNEGLPNSLIEGISYGLPIISTPVGGISEIVEDGANGFLIQPGDYIALADKIKLLSDNKDLREKMGTESLRIAKEKFDVNKIVTRLNEIYEELL